MIQIAKVLPNMDYSYNQRITLYSQLRNLIFDFFFFLGLFHGRYVKEYSFTDVMQFN